MPIDPTLALSHAPPPSAISWGAEEVLRYHVALGAGANPTHPYDLSLAYEEDLKVLPTFAVVAPSYGRTDDTPRGIRALPGIDVQLKDVLHARQQVTIHRPLPPSGSAQETTRVAELHDKGKAAIVVTETRILDEDDAPLATTRSSVFVKGEGGFGGDRGTRPDNAPPAGRAPDAVVRTPTLPQQALLYRLTGDMNRLHADPAFAAKAGFDHPILHGLCTYGIVCRAVIGEMLGGEVAQVMAFDASFVGIVFPGETLVTEVWRLDDALILSTTTAERGTPVLADVRITLRP